MNAKPISPRTHALIDYALTGALLIVPRLCKFPKKVIKCYTAEAMTLLPYVAITDSPVAVKKIIPFATHGKIDPFNVATFALQSCWRPFRQNRKALAFNIGFTALTIALVAFTDWQDKKAVVDQPI